MIKILTEPCETIYESLIDYAGQQCSTFSLIWQYDMKMNNSAHQIHQELIKFLESEQDVKSKWTAKDIKNEVFPKIRKFRVTTKSLSVLKKAPELYACPGRENKVSWRISKNRKPGLYSWISPALPEDLTFYTADGKVWLDSCSHEEDAFIESANLRFDEINSIVPGLDIESVK